MPYRVSAVSFLNAIPLIDDLAHPGADEAVLTVDMPSRLAAHLLAEEADVALLPVVEHLDGIGGGRVSTSGIACRGQVDSVKLFTSADLADLRQVATDRGSRTSVALLRILLAELHGVRPEFQETEPRPGRYPGSGEGLLVIGDRCFEYERDLARSSDHGIRGWDLGRMWLEATGLPFVFATWTMSPGFPERAGEEGVRDLGALLDRVRNRGCERLDAIAAREAAAGRLGRGGVATPEAVGDYFRHSLRYVLGEQELAGLRRFRELCLKHEIITAAPSPRTT